MSLIVGAFRVISAAVVLGLVEWLFPKIPDRWPFWGYLGCSVAVLVLIYFEILRRDVRALLIGVVDVALLTHFVHLVGSFSFVALGYLMQGVLYALAIGPRVAVALVSLGASGYLAILLFESFCIIPYGPYSPSWMHGSAPAPLTAVGVGGSVVLFSFMATAAVSRLVSRLEEERRLSDALLLNVLPSKVADRLKSSSESIAERFDEATVLFADVVGFTPLSSKLSPEQVVEMLGETFSRFDALAEQHGLEKIKTIGDAYMVAGGLPEARPDHACAVAEMALDMLAVVRDLRVPDGGKLDLRIGIHSGPVVAGVIGRKKFSYDLWGDTVNTASRMESHGVPGRIHVSRAVRDRLDGKFVLEERGTVELKGKGPVSTWFLAGKN